MLPRLKLGTNRVQYSSESNANAHPIITIKWHENHNDKPPQKVGAPLYPLDGSRVMGSQISFCWNQPTLEGGDTVVDYQFQLSDDPKVRWPLSPNFNIFTRAYSPTQPEKFRLFHPGLLNSGVRYYWKVRPRNSKGLLGPWSSVWSFTPICVMHPLNVRGTIENERIVLTWNQNTRGAQPVAYEVYASNESNGFTPTAQILVKRVAEPRLMIALDSQKPAKSFYRVIAISSEGEFSAPSEVYSLPFPRVLTRVRSVRAFDTCLVRLVSGERFCPVWRGVNDTDRSKVSVKLIRKPSWMTYDSGTALLSGCLDDDGVLGLTEDSALSTILVELDDGASMPVIQTIRLVPDRLESSNKLQLVAPYPEQVFGRSITPASLPFYWKHLSPMGGALFSYAVHVFNSEFDTLLQTSQDTVGFLNLDALPFGAYFWSVQATDGYQSFESVSSLFKVEMDKSILFSEVGKIPKAFSIVPGFPNPFNQKTNIQIGLPEESRVSVKMFNVRGQCVAVLAEGIRKAGSVHLSWTPNSNAASVYCLIVETEPLPGGQDTRHRIVCPVTFLR